MHSDDEKALATIRGAKSRKSAETQILKTFAFFLNTAEQKQLKGVGGSLRRSPDALILPVMDGRAQKCAGDFAPPPVITLGEVKCEIEALLRMRGGDVAAMRAGLANLLRRLP
jgi:hypothetical protein